MKLRKAPITAALIVNGANQLDQNLSQNLVPNAMPLGLGELRPKAAFYVELNAGISQSLITPSRICRNQSVEDLVLNRTLETST